VEFTGNYTAGHFQTYGNVAFQRAIGKQFESSQFNFAPRISPTSPATTSISTTSRHDDLRRCGLCVARHARERRPARRLGLRASLDLPNGTSIPNGAHLPYYRR